MTPKNDYQNQEQDRRIKWLEDHYSTFNSEMGEVKTDVALIKTDMRWLKRMMWWLISVIITGFGSLAGLIIKHIVS
jgi:hypothetical protein